MIGNIKCCHRLLESHLGLSRFVLICRQQDFLTFSTEAVLLRLCTRYPNHTGIGDTSLGFTWYQIGKGSHIIAVGTKLQIR